MMIIDLPNTKLRRAQLQALVERYGGMIKILISIPSIDAELEFERVFSAFIREWEAEDAKQKRPAKKARL